MDNERIFGTAAEWDFEKYAAVILYLNTYYINCMDEAERVFALSGQNDYCTVPVNAGLLERLGFEESLEEFGGEAQVMQDDMVVDDESGPLLRVTVEDGGDLTLHVDTVLFRAMADLPEIDDGFMQDENE